VAPQIFAAALLATEVSEGLETGHYAPLRRLLNENIHNHGRSKLPAELLQDATGGPLDIAPYLADLTEKVTEPERL